MQRIMVKNITAHTTTSSPVMTHPTIWSGLLLKAFAIWYVAVKSAVFGKTKEKKVIWKPILASCSGRAYFQKLPTDTRKNLEQFCQRRRSIINTGEVALTRGRGPIATARSSQITASG